MTFMFIFIFFFLLNGGNINKKYIFETNKGYLYLFDSEPIFLCNINTVLERKRQNIPILTSKEQDKLEIAIFKESNMISGGYFIQNLFINSVGGLAFNLGDSSVNLNINVFDLINEPLVYNNVFMSANSEVFIHKITSLNIVLFIKSITVSVTDFVHCKKQTYNYLYTPFNKEIYDFKINDSKVEIQEDTFTLDNIKGKIINVYEVDNILNYDTLVSIYRDSNQPPIKQITVKELRSNMGQNTIFVFLIIVFIVIIKKRRNQRKVLKLKNIIMEEKNFQIYTAMFVGKEVIAKIFVKGDSRYKKELYIYNNIHHPNMANFICEYPDKDSDILIFEKYNDINENLNTDDLFKLSKFILFLHKNCVAHLDVQPLNIKRSKRNEIILINFQDSEIYQKNTFITTQDCIKLNKIDDVGNKGDKQTNISQKFEKGSKNFRAPEIIFFNNNLTDLNTSVLPKSDAFSMGILIIFYLFLKGDQKVFELENIENRVLDGYYKVPTGDSISRDLVKNTLHYNANARLMLEQLVNHPLFWSNRKKFDFFVTLSDCLESNNLKNRRIYLRLQKNQKSIFNESWAEKLDYSVQEEILKFKDYQHQKVKSLLRAIRNKGIHFIELPNDIRNIFGSFPNGYIEYFNQKFPNLVISCFYAAKCSSDEDEFRNFYHGENF